MDVTLILGVHRTGSASFDHYMRANAARLSDAGIGFWGGSARAEGATCSMPPSADSLAPLDRINEAGGRIRTNLDRARIRGIRHLVISDPNIIGTNNGNLWEKRLYGAAGERIARYAQVFAGRLTRVVLSIRSSDTYWNSAIADAVGRGQRVPVAEDVQALLDSRRHWRQLITDLACALPDVEIQVHPYETLGSLPEHRLAAMTGIRDLPRKHAREWLNRAPGLARLREIVTQRGGDPAMLPPGDGRWQIFDRGQVMELRECYADDLFWLRGGAEGLATLIEETGPANKGTNPNAGKTQRGRPDGKEDRRMA